MVPEDVKKRFEKLKANGVHATLGGKASSMDIEAAQARLGKAVPARTLSYWIEINGLTVEDPALTILELAKLECDQRGFVRFALLEGRHWLALDARDLNSMGQWSVVNPDSGYRLAGTPQSFWSIHMWHWLLRRRPLWYDVYAWQRAADSVAIPSVASTGSATRS